VRDTAQKLGIHLFINARTDPFLRKFGSPDECLNEAAKRAKAYADAGADGIFVPGLTDLALIEKFAQLTPLPVNIMVTQGVPEIPDLARVGPSNADLIAIIRAKDDLICQLKTAALETDRLRDRVEQLEQLVGVDRSLTSRLRTAFGLEPGVAQVMGMLLKRDFVTHDALYVVLYAARPECDWPDARIVDVQISRLRRALRRHGITIKTQWGEG